MALWPFILCPFSEGRLLIKGTHAKNTQSSTNLLLSSSIAVLSSFNCLGSPYLSYLSMASSSNSSNADNKPRKGETVQAVYASVNENYPFWCSTFEHDLRNYYQPPDAPLELYVDATANERLGCFRASHSDPNPTPTHNNMTQIHKHDKSPSSAPTHCYLEYHPQCYPHYNPHYINYRHIVKQINVRYRPVALAGDRAGYLSLDTEKKEAVGEDVGVVQGAEVPDAGLAYEQVGRRRKRRRLETTGSSASAKMTATGAGVVGKSGVPTGMYAVNGTVMVRHTGLEVKLERTYDVSGVTPNSKAAASTSTSTQRGDGYA